MPADHIAGLTHMCRLQSNTNCLEQALGKRHNVCKKLKEFRTRANKVIL